MEGTNKSITSIWLIILTISVVVIYGSEIISSSSSHNGNHGFYRNGASMDGAQLWMSFMAILSTVFAVFFVYSGFRIENLKTTVSEYLQQVKEAERHINEDIYEYSTQLQYAMSFLMSRQYSKAIDAFTVLRNEAFVLKDSKKVNTCDFMLANCFFERWREAQEEEDIAKAVEYINEAIEAPSHPLKMEIIEAFENNNS